MSATKPKVQFDTDQEASSRVLMPMTQVATKRHPEFYFDDNPVVIQIEDTLFRVHKYQLLKSETFSDMFTMPKGSTKDPVEGASPERPIVLEGVRSSDFVALLKVLYAVKFSDEELKYESDIIVPAFRLAHMWNFAGLRAHLLPLVKGFLGCVDTIILARELGIQEWLVPAHVELCQRTEPLSMAEATKLGMHSTVMVTGLREQLRPSQSVSFWSYCGLCVSEGTSPIYTTHGAASCQQCGAHIDSSTEHFRFPVTPSGTALDPGRIQIYCYSCGTKPPSCAQHGEAVCHRCGIHLGSGITYYRFTVAHSGPASLGGNVELESQIKKWVEGGCITE